ncbi:hypothetical protein QBC34DRAFT_431230 [Podospora aff. communis PSN243]|uniref:Fungal-type protein kinase domain-containing protein n=1 Tax=Podospora aff. communis PSN243 TaxID=3040156 RepID=A0AAV9G742_9PEZI|nr:hypothetical protein QBC34DRAFT_431230 [Podospora aff. communis PSN243]
MAESPRLPLSRPQSLALSQLSPELVERQGKLIAWMLKPKSESGLGLVSFQSAGIKIDQTIVDLCTLLYDDKDAPKPVSVEYFYYLVWALIHAASATPFPWDHNLLHWQRHGFTPAQEYLDYVRRRQMTEPLRIPYADNKHRTPALEYDSIKLRLLTQPTRKRARIARREAQNTPARPQGSVLQPQVASAQRYPKRQPTQQQPIRIPSTPPRDTTNIKLEEPTKGRKRGLHSPSDTEKGQKKKQKISRKE